MCGLAGLLTTQRSLDWHATLVAMADSLTHRGPDDSGHWFDAERGVGLAHRRLAIVDLAPTGCQPMCSTDGRYVIAFNGEIYNHAGLRIELEALGVIFRGHSDTEAMLAAISVWGLEAALARFIGMFAFTLWDKKERALYLVRDRLGIKPLYYTVQGHVCAFASELKAFTVLPDWQPEIAPLAAYEMLRLGYVPGNQAIFKDVYKLPPGHLLKVSMASDALHVGDPVAYWSLRQFVDMPSDLYDERDAQTEMTRLIEDAVAMRMVADVPLGAFLSGGIDSTLVVAAMQRHASSPVKTFSIGFANKAYDEAENACAVAKHLGTEHHELYISEKDMLALVEDMPEMYDEPFADPSQLPTALLARLTHEHVTVALSGDGGDELCAGYTRHYEAARIDRLCRMPRSLRTMAGHALQSLSVGTWDQMAKWMAGISRSSVRLPGDKLHKLARALMARDTRQLYEAIVGSDEIHRLWRGDNPSWGTAPDTLRKEMAPGEAFVLQDMLRYLPDDVLTKVDRASMASGLEVRVPLLDHRLVELTWRVPFSLKVREGKGKWLLRRILADWVPQSLWDRPKMGFSVPIGDWIKGELKGWAEYYLLDDRFYHTHGMLDKNRVEKMWKEHMQGVGNHQYQIWNILMLHAWYARWVN